MTTFLTTALDDGTLNYATLYDQNLICALSALPQTCYCAGAGGPTPLIEYTGLSLTVSNGGTVLDSKKAVGHSFRNVDTNSPPYEQLCEDPFIDGLFEFGSQCDIASDFTNSPCSIDDCYQSLYYVPGSSGDFAWYKMCQGCDEPNCVWAWPQGDVESTTNFKHC